MGTGEFAAPQWIERLAGALAELAETQKRYQNEFDRQFPGFHIDDSGWLVVDPPSHDLHAFYSQACSGKDQSHAGDDAPLCTALAAVRRVLVVHPAWAGLGEPLGDRGVFRIQIQDDSRSGSLLGMISGLMARGMEVSENGFSVAAAELHGLLDPGGNREPSPGRGDLSVGYHVAVFHGLRVREKVQLPDDIMLLPFEQLDEFVNESILHEVVPAFVRDYSAFQESLGALVQPFRWKPELRKPGDWKSKLRLRDFPSLDGGQSFFGDAAAFIELLALFHAAPILYLAMLPYRIRRSAAYLLGALDYEGSAHFFPQSFNRVVRSPDLSMTALNDAIKVFGDRKSDNYKHCAPIIARLAEARKRGGQFQIEDMILDVAIALERMYELDGGEISFKLKTRAAFFLEASTEGRRQVFRDVEQLYNARSAIVHRRKKRPSPETISDALTRGFKVARRSVVKLLRDGPPPDWNELVLAGTESDAAKPGSGQETT